MDSKKNTEMKSGFKGLLVLLFLVLTVSLIPHQAYAADSSLDSSKLAALESKFPNGQYWDHLCTDVSTTRSEDYQDSVTSHACSHTESVGYYDCNHFDSGAQCVGFARKLAYEYYGVKFSSRARSYNIDDLKAGDIVRYHPGSVDHSIWVLSVSGDTVTYADCNYTGPCQIRWYGTTTKSTIKSSLIHIEQAPDEISISLNKSSAALYLDETVTLTATVKGSDGTVTWKSSDSSVASVNSSGKVTAKKAGTTTITASISGQEATCSITVKNPSIKLNKSSKTMYMNGTYKLVATVEGASSKVTWRSSKSSVATVNSKGKISAKKAGTTTITATANGKSAKCKITVKEPSTKLNVSSKSMTVGDTYTLKATVKGASSEVTWKSSKPSVASVSSKGKVSAKKAGTTTITAKANGKSAKCKITVKNVSKKSKALKAYNTFLTNKAKTENGREFTLAYVDKDSVPELYYDGNLYKYNNGSVVKMTFSTVSAFSSLRGYYKKKGIVTTIYGRFSTGYMDYSESISYFKVSGKTFKQLSLSKFTHEQYNAKGKLTSTTKTYSVGSKDVTKSQFNKKLKSYVGSKKETTFSKTAHKNTAKNRKKYLK